MKHNNTFSYLTFFIVISSLLPFNSAYDVTALKRLCYASSLSYLPLDAMRTSPYYDVARFSPLVQVEDPITESGATIFQDDEDESRMIVACRGSATPKNFATNLRLNLVPAEKPFDRRGRIHAGFQEAAQGLWGRLAPELQRIQESRQLCFTGHSLGGATALLCAGHAGASKSTKVTEVVTFGGPRVGDAMFASHINEELLADCTIRLIIHESDPILAQNKPLWDRMGFESTGEEIICDPYRSIIYDQSDKPSVVAWNFIDHCQYLGTFVGPRIIL
uniref:Fungal lipase-type domain-containing protein n=1 Tax=Ditylum brightwellii TaxID=49249 RepID=A0A7S4SLZ2_9STRA|mmetsp:Transcript_23433/g.31076  ORF Transcript_23433/g.31076 Transcript_23433/m.31076 type:complete len:276 (+) Transcript_23433:35-862(+)